MSQSLKDKVVLITGSSRGIGLGIAKEFAKNGAVLILTEIESRFEKLLKISQELETEYKVKVHPISMDIKNLDQIKTQVESLEKPFNKVDILINNAGINIIMDSFEITEREFDEICSINLKGTFFVTQEIAKNMVGAGIKGSIINISSQHGIVGNTDRAIYCATKAGIINMSRALAYEWSKYKIRINCVSPTYVETDNNREFLQSTKGKRTYLNKIPLKDYARPEDIAKACIFLASDKSRLITGQNIVIDGGYTSV